MSTRRGPKASSDGLGRDREAERLARLALLAGGAVHDLNNLLTVMGLNAKLALAEVDPGSNVARYLRAIELAADQSGGLTRQLLADAGDAAARKRPVDLSVVVREALTLVAVSLGPAAKIVTNLAEDLPLVEADGSQLRRVVMNLLTNAFEALPRGSGTIALTTGVRVMTADELGDCQLRAEVVPGTFVFVEIEDTGPGMDEATRVRLFEPFFSTKSTRRGLGLAGAAGIVRAHAGAIRVESGSGAGTRFTVLYPAAQAHRLAPPADPGG